LQRQSQTPETKETNTPDNTPGIAPSHGSENTRNMDKKKREVACIDSSNSDAGDAKKPKSSSSATAQMISVERYETGGVKQMRFIVNGQPQTQARPRKARSGHIYNPSAAKQKALRKAVNDLLHEWGIDTPVYSAPQCVFISLSFNLQRPNSHFVGCRRSSGKIKPSATPLGRTVPNLDNLQKLILDALNGVVYGDDRQVTDLQATKRYDDSNFTGSTEVVVGLKTFSFSSSLIY